MHGTEPLSQNERSWILDRSNIQAIITKYRESKIQSEAEVRSKLIVPLLEVLGYASKYRAEEFPVYGYGGRERLSTKNADFLLFDNEEFADHRANMGSRLHSHNDR